MIFGTVHHIQNGKIAERLTSLYWCYSGGHTVSGKKEDTTIL